MWPLALIRPDVFMQFFPLARCTDGGLSCVGITDLINAAVLQLIANRYRYVEPFNKGELLFFLVL